MKSRSSLQRGTIVDPRTYMLQNFPYVALRDDMKPHELKALADKWHKLAQNSPAYRKRSSDSVIKSDEDTSADATSSDTNPTQPALKKQKPSPLLKTPRPVRKNTSRLREVARASKRDTQPPRKISKTSKIDQPSDVHLIDFGTEDLDVANSKRPARSSKRIVTYSSSLTALSDDEDHLDSHVKTSQPESPAPQLEYLSDEAFLKELAELEGLVFEPSQIPPITSSKSTPHESSTTFIGTPRMDAQVNLMDFDDVDHLQSLDKKEVELPALQLSSKACACKCECHEDILHLKSRIQKLEELVLSREHALPSCCASTF